MILCVMPCVFLRVLNLFYVVCLFTDIHHIDQVVKILQTISHCMVQPHTHTHTERNKTHNTNTRTNMKELPLTTAKKHLTCNICMPSYCVFVFVVVVLW